MFIIENVLRKLAVQAATSLKITKAKAHKGSRIQVLIRERLHLLGKPRLLWGTYIFELTNWSHVGIDNGFLV